MRLSVIIPVAAGETAHEALLPDLAGLPDDAEILLCAATALPERPGARNVRTRPGRAMALNDCAAVARGQFLWFLHADSRVDELSLQGLFVAIERHPDRLLYFDLRFSGGPRLLALNSHGVRLRAALGMPFGDQGFCIARDRFVAAGRYPEDLPRGEDHAFVWRARKTGTRPKRIGATMYTSGRKYEKRWFRTTLTHLRLTISQAFAELCR